MKKRRVTTLKWVVIILTVLIIRLNDVSGQVATLQNWTNIYHGKSTSQQNISCPVSTGSDANRVLIVAIASTRTPAGSVSVTIAYGGIDLTPADGDMSSSSIQHTALYYLDEAGLDAAADQTLSVTVSGGFIRNTDIWAALFDYVNQTNPVTDNQMYTSGGSSVTTFAFGTALTINAYNQAVEVISSLNAGTQPRTITYAADWTMTDEQTATYVQFNTYSIKNGIVNRNIPNSDITDISSTSFNLSARASMTGLSLNYEIPPPPTIQASDITFSDVTTSSFTISWTRGNGTNRLVLVKAGSAVDSDPADQTTYTASNLFGDGSEIGTGNFVVYNGTGNSVSVDNLNANTTYHVAVYEFSGPPGMEDYLTPPATGSQLTAPETALTDDYRSVASGYWNDAGNWQTYDGSSWVPAGTAPNSASGLITIRNGDTIVIAEAVAADQVVIAAGAQVTVDTPGEWTIANGADVVDCDVIGTIYNSGTIIATGVAAFNSGSVYQHACDGGSIPAAVWDTNSECRITGIINTAPSGFGQSFGNFIWNCPSQSPSLTVAMNNNITIKGNFTLTSTGSNKLAITDGSTSLSMTVTGDFLQTGGTFDLNSGPTGSATVHLYVAGDFMFTGGTITESSSAGRGSVHFNGSGDMQTFTGAGTFNNTIDFTVETGAYLQMGTGSTPSIITGSSGTFTLSAGATLGITDLYGITLTATGSAAGNIRVTGTRHFDTEANYIFNGSTNQYTNTGLPSTVNSLVFDNNGGAVTFNAARTITNSFSITSGSKANLGNSFIHTAGFLLLGGIAQPDGSYGGTTSGAEYVIPEYFNPSTGVVNVAPPYGTWLGNTTNWNEDANWIGGIPESSGNAIISSFAPNQPVITGTTTAFCNVLTINNGASLDIEGTAEITTAENNGKLTIKPGGRATINTLTNNDTLNLESDASGMFSLMLDSYSGTGTVNSELFLTGGLAGDPADELYRWHYFAVPSQQNKSVLTAIDPENLMRYDEPGAQNDMWEGWQWHDGYDGTTGFDELFVTDGYNFYHDEDTYVTFTGNSLLTSLPVKNLSFTQFGWNFLGNSLTCGINWDNVTLNGDMDPAVHFLKDYEEYYYIQGGPGIPAGTTGHIPPLQGFFVQANASGASVDFTGAKEHNSTSYYKGASDNSGSKSSFPLIRLTLGNDVCTDETVVWFNDNATADYDNKFDAQKWVSEGSRPQIYSYSKNKDYAINAIPFPEKSVDIPLAVHVPGAGTYSVNMTELEAVENYGFYLKDLVLKTKTDLKNVSKYSFSASEGTVKGRFILSIENRPLSIESESLSDEPFNIYPSFGFLNIELISDAWEGRTGSVKVIDFTGRPLIDKRDVLFSKTSPIQIPMAGFKGLCMVELTSYPLRHVGRIIIR